MINKWMAITRPWSQISNHKCVCIKSNPTIIQKTEVNVLAIGRTVSPLFIATLKDCAKSNDLIVNIAQTKRYADMPIVSSMVKYIKYLKQKWKQIVYKVWKRH